MPRAFFVAMGLVIAAHAHASAQVTRLPRPQPEYGADVFPQPAAPAATPGSTTPAATAGLDQQSYAKQLATQLGELNRLQQEIDHLRQATGTPSQVLVKLELLEISLTKLKLIGAAQQAPGSAKLVDQFLSAPSKPLDEVEFGPELAALLDGLYQEQIARRLAAWSLIVSSGSPASFHQGLEVPQIKKDNNLQWVEYQKLGAMGDVTAQALGNDRVGIELRLRTPRDRPIGPSLTTDEPTLDVNAGVETTLGQTAIAQCSYAERRSVEKRVVAGIGEIPLIGRAFSRTRETKEGVLTLLLVTPEAVPEFGNVAGAAAGVFAPVSRQKVMGQRVDRQEALRQQSDHDLLAIKLAELNALQPEVDRLRHLCRQRQQVVVSLKMMDLSRSRLKDLQKKLGGSDAALIERLLAGQPFGAIDDTERLQLMLQHLGRDGAVTNLSEPSLAAWVGRPANFNSGGEFPVVVAEGMGGTTVKNKKRGTVDVLYKKFGTEVGFMPIAVNDRQARFHLHYRCSEIDDSHRVEMHGINLSGLRVREVQTDVDVPLGQTTIVHAATSTGVMHAEPRPGAKRVVTAWIEDLITLVLVTPKTVDTLPDQEPPPPAVAPVAPVAPVTPVAPPAPVIAAARGPAIQVECRMLEIDVTKLRALDFDLTKLQHSPDVDESLRTEDKSHEPTSDPLSKLVASNTPEAKKFIETLEREGVAKFGACPQLTTFAGRQAEVHLGREIDVPAPGEPPKVGKDFVGTHFRVLPSIDDKGRVVMELKMRVSEQGEVCPFKIDNQTVYRVKSVGLETTVAVEDGQTMLFGGMHTGVAKSAREQAKTAKARPPQDGLPSDGVSRYTLVTARIVRPKPPTSREAKVIPAGAAASPK